jgi:D-alanyl-D-alanine carboxypeptidase/D-alanyl-D-alanine-endopeptidase (penicillin-binding protein 4)
MQYKFNSSRLVRAIVTVAFVLAGAMIVGAVQAQNRSLQRQIDSRITAKGTPNAHWAVSVRDENGVEIASHNSDKLMVPASNMKLVTSAAILEELGPEFRYVTNIYGRGKLVGRTWVGDLYIAASGDPSINGDFYDDDDLYVFKKFAEQLRTAGIDSVRGIVFGNTSVFDGQHLPPDWDWYDLPFYYAAEVGPLSFNSNTVFLDVNTSGKIGSKPEITWFPFNTDYVTFINNQRITARGTSYRESYKRMPGSNVITLASRLPQGYVETEALTVSNPTMFFLDSFVKFLTYEGFSMDVKFYEDPFPNNWSSPEFTLLATHESEPLSSLLQKVNKDSDNLYAEMLLKTLAHHRKGGAGSIRSGEIAANQRFSIMRLDTNYVSFRDGSGLSSTNLVSTGFLSGLLHAMTGSSNFSHYDSSMTIAGVDGTFRNRLRGTPLEGNLRGKSGSISRTRAFSGYLRTKSGKLVSFSMIANNFRVPARDIDRVHEAIATLIFDAL